jgi:hypothetical protein
MRCEKVLGQLSWFVDEVLKEDLAAEVAQHLRDCPDCRSELARLKKLLEALKGMEPVIGPDYLGDLVKARIDQTGSTSWRKSLRSAFEYRWSRIKATEGIGYLTRLVGAMATVVLFVAVYSAMNPLYLTLADQIPTRVAWPKTQASQQLAFNMQKAFGMPGAQKTPIRSSEARINDLYLDKLGQNLSRTAHDDTVSVFYMVDRNGTAKVQDILEYPTDDSLLSDFTEMINSAVWRPASQNGRAVDSRQVRIFSTIYVYN